LAKHVSHHGHVCLGARHVNLLQVASLQEQLAAFEGASMTQKRHEQSFNEAAEKSMQAEMLGSQVAGGRVQLGRHRRVRTATFGADLDAAGLQCLFANNTAGSQSLNACSPDSRVRRWAHCRLHGEPHLSLLPQLPVLRQVGAAAGQPSVADCLHMCGLSAPGQVTQAPLVVVGLCRQAALPGCMLCVAGNAVQDGRDSPGGLLRQQLSHWRGVLGALGATLQRAGLQHAATCATGPTADQEDAASTQELRLQLEQVCSAAREKG
jgi:hypothetical protein